MRFFLWRVRLYLLMSAQEDAYDPAVLWKHTGEFRKQFDQQLKPRAAVTAEMFYAEE